MREERDYCSNIPTSFKSISNKLQNPINFYSYNFERAIR